MKALKQIPYKQKLLFAVFVFLFMFVFITRLPKPLFCVPYSTVLTDKNGNLAAAAIASDEQWRFPLHDSIPDKFVKAIVCFEDKRFFNHPGIDPFAIARAFKKNFSSGSIKSGASTLTMQVVRLARCKKKRTIIEKCIEMYYAIQLEIFYSKNEILRLYAAHAPFGGNVVGLETASWRYFGRSPHALSWAETCMLAVLPNAPSLIHPGKNRSMLLKKRNSLLNKLLDESIISKETWQLSIDEPLPPSPHPIPLHIPHLLTRYQSQRATLTQLKKTPCSIYKNNFAQTTIDLNIQKQAETICNRHHHRLAGNNIHNIAALILDIKENSVVAYIGNVRDSLVNNSYFVDCIEAPRSTGSTLKPFLYCAMNYTGQLIPSQIIADVPTRIAGFAPRNYTRTFEGAVPASVALAKSLNVPAVRMLYDYGVDHFYGDLKKTGLTTLTRKASEYGLSLILGGAEGTLWDLTSAFAGMARTVNAYFDSTVDKKQFFYEHPAYLQNSNSGFSSNSDSCQENPFDAGSCWLTLTALLEVNRPDIESSWKSYLSSKRISWKTGTSYGHRDGWAIGVTPDYAIGVWVGNAGGGGRPNLTGISTAAPILFELFGLLKSGAWFDKPEMQLSRVNVCQNSGFKAGNNCEKVHSIIIHTSGNETPLCKYCQTVHLDNSKQWRVHGNCESIDNINTQKMFILPALQEHYFRKLNSGYRPLPPTRPDCLMEPEALQQPSVAIVYPRNGSEIYIPVELDNTPGKVVLEAAHRNREAALHWHLDQEYIGTTRFMHQISVTPQPGNHTITLVDEYGEIVTCNFVVLAKS